MALDEESPRLRMTLEKKGPIIPPSTAKLICKWTKHLIGTEGEDVAR